MDVEDESQFEGSLALALTGIIILGLKWGTRVSPEDIWSCWLLSLPFPGEIFLWDLEHCRQNVAEACASQSVGYSTLCGIFHWGCSSTDEAVSFHSTKANKETNN